MTQNVSREQEAKRRNTLWTIAHEDS